jgi:DNA replicative helicase MCM subunit Mcm2 (Cdc46/Mcm family)
MELSNSAKWGGGAGGKKGNRESGLHQLYVLANTIICTKSSNDRLVAKVASSSTPGTDNEDEEDNGLESMIVDGIRTLSTQAFGGTPMDAFRFTKFKPPELEFIAKLAHMEQWCLPILLHNFCPIIYGQELVKFGLLLALFGGTNMAMKNPELVQSNWRIRSNIHVLVVGDPGLGKVRFFFFISFILFNTFV